MRKGADCLSKWVGEAERQLRYDGRTDGSKAGVLVLAGWLN